MTKLEAAKELKRRGWKRTSRGYIPPHKGYPRCGIDFRSACSLAMIEYEPDIKRPVTNSTEGK